MTDLFGNSHNFVFDLDFACLRVYDAYPKKGGRKMALAKIQKAIKYLSSSSKVDLHDASLQLLHSTQMYANSPDVKEKLSLNNGKFIPMCQAWIHQGRYEDPDSVNGYVEETNEVKSLKQDMIDLGVIDESA